MDEITGQKGFRFYFFCHQRGNKKAGRSCMNFSSTSVIVHELEPKKMRIWLWWADKT